MRYYNVQNYIRYKQDIEKSLKRIENKNWEDLTKDELIIKYLPLVENIARKFSTTQQASGVMSIMDLLQEGSAGLVKGVGKLDWDVLLASDDIDKTIKSFLSKRIKGAIRRAIDINRGQMRLPEYMYNEIRKGFGKDKKMVAMFFNSIFLSIDAKTDDENMVYQIPDESEPYNMYLLNIYLISLLKQHLDIK